MRRVSLFLATAASIWLPLQLKFVYAQDATERFSRESETHAVQNSTSDVTASPTREKGRQIDVKAYGAVGDGVTNDTAAFNAALQSLADAGGGTCLVPKGTYIISASGITTLLMRSSSALG